MPRRRYDDHHDDHHEDSYEDSHEDSHEDDSHEEVEVDDHIYRFAISEDDLGPYMYQ